MTPAPALLAVGRGSTALWYFTRSTGLVAFIVLSAAVIIGVIASIGWTTERWPRFLSQAVHRNLSLFCIGLVGVHVVTTVGDGYVPIGFADAVIPFRSPYRPIWVGLGALTFDLLLAVLVTSALRHRIGFRSWRFVHWLAYLSWPIALFHGLGSGTDTHLPVVLLVDVTCTLAVVAVVIWRLVSGRSFPVQQRLAATVATAVVIVSAVAFAAEGPLQPGWAHRAGTSSSLLGQLSGKGASAPVAISGSGVGGQSSPTTAPPSNTVPTVPFTETLDGTQQQAGPDSQGNVQVTLTTKLHDAGSTPLIVTLSGTAAAGGGVAMSSGAVSLGPYHGVVTALEGGSVTAVVGTQPQIQLAISLNLDQTTGTLTGTVSGSAAGGGSR
jgi:methionine sulfoxide reductase heme-binding subunit